MNQRHTNTNYQPMKMCYYYDNTNKIDNSSFIRNNTNPYNPITNLQHYNQNQQQLRSFNRTNNNNNNNNTSFNNNISNNNCKQQPSVRFVSISNNTNTKIMQSQPIYEGVEPIMFNNNNKTLNSNLSFGDFNGTGIYSNVTDVDPSFFTPNEYDNAQTNNVRHVPINTTQTRPINTSNTMRSYQQNNNIAYNGSNMSSPTTSRINSMSANFDRILSVKSSTSSSVNDNSALSSRFETIRKNCFATKILFVDPEFPASDVSLYKGMSQSDKQVKWLRPQEIVQIYNQRNDTNLKPEFSVQGYENCDLNQGELGDCWVVAALATMTSHDYEKTNLLSKLIPSGQSFRPGWYVGAFQFRFWRNGEWRDVIIDDMLPTINGKLYFISSYQPNEFWGALIEKAYAKINGSYETLDGGQLTDALDDFTGGMTETYSLNKQFNTQSGLVQVPNDIDDKLIKAFECHSLITTGIFNDQRYLSRSNATNILPNGLVAGHAYTISDIRKIRLTNKNGIIQTSIVNGATVNSNQAIVTLLRIRNPWGNEVEWKGSWSDRSKEWRSVSDLDKKSIGLIYRKDGEFWISLNDFLTNFHTLDICHLPYEAIINIPRPRHYWHCLSYFGDWVPGISAGGRPIFTATHYTNPQYRINIGSGQSSSSSSSIEVMIGLLQEDPRGSEPTISTRGNLSIGFVVYQLPKLATIRDQQTPLGPSFFRNNSYIASVDSFINSREVVKRVQLPSPGIYVVVPSTYESNISGKFLLRIMTPCDSSTNHHPSILLSGISNNDINSNSISNNSNSNNNNSIDTITTNTGIGNKQDIVVRQLFFRESGSDMALNAAQLFRVVNSLLKEKGVAHYHQLDLDCCRHLIVLFTSMPSNGMDHAGSTNRLHESQFSALWVWLLRAIKLAQAADTLGPLALRTVLDSSGVLQGIPGVTGVLFNLTQKFANEAGHVSIPGYISILAILTLYKEMFDNLSNGSGSITLNKEEFMNIVTKM